jgi:hypothetical protein
MLAIWMFKAPLIAAGAGAGLAALGYMFYKDRKSSPTHAMPKPRKHRTVTFGDGFVDERTSTPTGSPRIPSSPILKSVVATPDVLAVSQEEWEALDSQIRYSILRG